MIRINIATHTRTFGYRADRLWRDLRSAANRLCDPVIVGALVFLIGLTAVVLVPLRRAPGRLSVAASVLAVGATYLALCVLVSGASPAWLAALVVSCAAAFAHLVQAFPSDHGWWLCEVQEVALELIDTLEPPRKG